MFKTTSLIKSSIFIKLILIFSFLIINLLGCGNENKNERSGSIKKSNNNVKSISLLNSNGQDKIVLSVSQENNHNNSTNNYADVSSIIAKINLSKNMLALEDRIDNYTSKMFQKSGFDKVDRPKRACALFRNSGILPGRILSDKDIAALCKDSLNEVTEELSDLIDRSFTDSPRKRLPAEDAVAILNYLIEYGSTDVSLQSQVNLGTYFNRIKEDGEKGLELQLEAIQKAQNMNYSIDKILQWKANSIQSLLYLDRLEEADLKAEKLLNEYEEKRKNVKEWDESWDNLFLLYTYRIMAWSFENPEHAIEICNEALKVNNGMVEKNGDPLGFESKRDWLLRRISLNNNK